MRWWSTLRWIFAKSDSWKDEPWLPRGSWTSPIALTNPAQNLERLHIDPMRSLRLLIRNFHVKTAGSKRLFQKPICHGFSKTGVLLLLSSGIKMSTKWGSTHLGCTPLQLHTKKIIYNDMHWMRVAPHTICTFYSFAHSSDYSQCIYATFSTRKTWDCATRKHCM